MVDDNDTRAVVLATELEAPLLPTLLQAEVEAARGYAAASRSRATRRAYLSDWTIFASWCVERGIDSPPAVPGAVATFSASQADAGVKTSTLGRRLAAIGWTHRKNGLDPPQSQVGAQAIRDVLGVVRRTQAVRKENVPPTPICCTTCCGPSRVTGPAPCATAPCLRSAWRTRCGVRSWRPFGWNGVDPLTGRCRTSQRAELPSA